MRRSVVTLTVLLLGGWWLHEAEGQETPPPSKVIRSLSASLVNTMQALDDKQRLGPGDRVSLRIIEDEEAPHALALTDSGEMEVPYLGRVKAANKTCKQLAGEIKSLLEREYYSQATVIIGIDTVGQRTAVSRGQVFILGEVRTPGTVEIRGEEVLTASKAVMRAGGFGEYANKRKVKLLRRASEQGVARTTTTIVDLVEVLEKGVLEKDVELQPEDRVIVPERFINF